MKVHIYAIRIEADQLVAAEIDDSTAAELIVSGQPLLLGAESELHAFARRLGVSRTVLFRCAARKPQPRPAVALAGGALVDAA
ncbi:MAG: hypothetical protein HUU20_28250 [Pirellulales bacterium]|nr:hypothetical protein [Pirellulales bacterium]